MLLRDEVQLLRNIPYFKHVDPCKLKLLAFASQRATYKPGDILFRQGDGGDSAYVILSGKVDLLSGAPTGEVRIGEADSKSIIGEMSLLCHGPRRMTARAATEVETLRIAKDCLGKVMADSPRMSMEFSRALAERLRAMTTELDTVRLGQLSLVD
ncbi:MULTISPECIES: cyclic nucleotide-binding domain-containing protein [Rhizobium/Agrobacterium group]|uniref:cyclic nucleotide-binding domain-containing protein n=1 Tax=Rhizobium/Agrobacterium group TaxID=227290 RepID=UPI000B400C42|nr:MULTISPECIES: Crp/Fnr family transcriptional regulator [Rhizobium/Agrobacterium group]MCF1482390.1 Crp/Fnr family transcriptional regulator [Allorhizobium ampelinum]NSZ43969.1 Crp/Fnr family transcriptional regulator [Agrobacterium vitis]NTA27717.1 Crp/Fnr family transcriptional regulator [Allorhizobium ampelinum]OVE94057.1 cyclic nucleotide-binding protein [Allorhizobium ampelinum]